MANDNLVVLKTFDDVIQANLVVSTIENAGYECFTADHRINSSDPFGSLTTNGIKVRVQAKDKEAILELLKKAESTKNEEE